MAVLFISYSRRDAKAVDSIVAGLQKLGHNIRLDRTHIAGGEDWQKWIETNIQQAEAIILFWSSEAAKSEWVQREVSFADGLSKLIIPVCLDSTPISNIRLANIQKLPAGNHQERQRIPAQINATLIGSPISSPLLKTPILKPQYRLEIIIALIGAIATIIAAVISVLPALLPPAMLTPTALITVPTNAATNMPTASEIPTILPTTAVPSSTNTQSTASPTTIPIAHTPVSNPPFSLETFNLWQQDNGYSPAKPHTTLMGIAATQLGYIMSGVTLLDLTQQPTLVYLDNQSRTAQEMATFAGYNGPITLIVFIGDAYPTLNDVLRQLETVSGQKAQREYTNIGIAQDNLISTGKYYLVIFLGQ